LATSPKINGNPRDLEIGTFQGSQRLVTLHSRTEPNDTFHVFELGDLTPVALPGGPARNVGNSLGGLSIYGDTADLEIVSGPGGITLWLLLIGSEAVLIEPNSMAILSRRILPTFAPMAWPIDVAAGDLGPFGAGDPTTSEFVVATKAGYVAWLPSSVFTQDNTPSGPNATNLAEAVAVNGNLARGGITLGFPNGQTNFRPAYCNRTTSATWAMTLDHTGTSLQLLDQSGSRWRMAANGDLTYLYDLRKDALGISFPIAGPFRTMVSLGNQSWPTSGGVGTVAVWSAPSLSLVPGVSTYIRYETHPFVPHIESIFPQLGFGSWWNDPKSIVHIYDGYAVLPMGGATLAISDPSSTGTVRQVHWWGGEDLQGNWPNLLQGLFLNSSGAVTDWWTTTQGPATGGLPVPSATLVSHSSIQGNDLRDGFPFAFTANDTQSMRVFADPASGEARVVVATAGGSAIVLDPTTVNTKSPLQAESEDFGVGGMGLAVTNSTTENLYNDIYLGVLGYHGDFQNHQNRSGSSDQVGAVVWLWWDGSALVKENVRVLDGSSPDHPKAYGVCGIAVGDVLGPDANEEIVVTTLDGWFLVFAKLPEGYLGALLYKEKVEGALGAYNSIIIADLDPGAFGNEVYVAGSLGVRKWVRS
jgi:hypothetical protein